MNEKTLDLAAIFLVAGPHAYVITKSCVANPSFAPREQITSFGLDCGSLQARCIASVLWLCEGPSKDFLERNAVCHNTLAHGITCQLLDCIKAETVVQEPKSSDGGILTCKLINAGTCV